MPHELPEKVTGLASRVNELVVNTTGPVSREFMKLEIRLSDLALAAIVADLKAERADYQAALDGLNDAIEQIDAAGQKIERVEKIIKSVAKAADLAEKVLSKALV